jgi:hypothetical protein
MGKEYPEEVIAISKKGEREARILLSKGEYIKYRYKKEGGGEVPNKYTIILKTEEGYEEFMFVKTAGRKELLVKHEIKKQSPKVFDEKGKKVETL